MASYWANGNRQIFQSLQSEKETKKAALGLSPSRTPVLMSWLAKGKIPADWEGKTTGGRVGRGRECRSAYYCFEWGQPPKTSETWSSAGGPVQRWLDHEGDDFFRGLIHWWVCSWTDCEKLEGDRKKATGDVAHPLPHLSSCSPMSLPVCRRWTASLYCALLSWCFFLATCLKVMEPHTLG